MLPQINDVPKYTMTIPSTKKKVTYRPFLVKEQKVLLIAMESQDQGSIVRAIIDTLKSCVEDELNYDSLATFDVEYMFTQIRGKSVGEKSNLVFKCESCSSEIEYSLDLSKIKVDVKKDNNMVKLNDQYTIQMKYPTYSSLTDIVEEESNTQTLLNMLTTAMDSLLTDDERISFSDYTSEQILEFINTLNTEQFEAVTKFVTDAPRLQHKVKYKCGECGHNHETTLQGIQDFF